MTDGLRTWRLQARPEPGAAIPATPLGLHRKAYLDYEGPLSGNRGTVKQWDAGLFDWHLDDANRVVVRLEGRLLCGAASLERTPAGDWHFVLSLVPTSKTGEGPS